MDYTKNLPADDKNVAESFKNDSVGRKKFVLNFVSLFCGIPGNTSISLSGDWGSGKTFFVKQAKLVLDKNNRISGENVEPEFKAELDKSFVTLYFDAWLHDNDEEPITSLITSLTEAAGFGDESYKNEKVKKAGKLGASILKIFLPKTTETALSILMNAVDYANTQKAEFRSESEKTAGLIKEFYDAIIPEHGDRLVVFIDELDRCKPDFAVRFLERIKHYLMLDDRVIFVFSINREQLEETIKHFYGYGFDSHRYLDRFFDLNIELPAADVDKFCLYIDENSKSGGDHAFFIYYKNMTEYFNMSLREMTKYFSAMNILYEKHSLDAPTAFYESTKQCVLYIFAPILCAAKMTSSNKYDELVSGRGSDIIREIGNKFYLPEFVRLWGRGETSYENPKTIYVSVADKCVKLYETVFMYPIENESVAVGRIYVRSDTKEFFLDAINSILL